MYIDTASTSDISALCDLASLLETQEGDFFGRRHQQVRRLGNLLLAKEHALVLCIRDQEEVIAMLTLSSLNPDSDQPAIMRLNDMAVLPAYQGQGAGSMLLQAAINQARQAGWSKIVVHQTDINPTIQQQLSRFGFSPAGQQIQLSLRADKASLSVA